MNTSTSPTGTSPTGTTPTGTTPTGTSPTSTTPTSTRPTSTSPTGTSPTSTGLDTELEPIDPGFATTSPAGDDRTGRADADFTAALPITPTMPPAPPRSAQDGAGADGWRARVGAGVATALLLAAVIAFMIARTGSSTADPVATPTTDQAATPTAPAVPDEPVASVPPASGVPTPTAPAMVAVVPDPEQSGGSGMPPTPSLEVQELPPVVAPPVPPAPETPAPAPLLGAQLLHELDPGVDNLTITLANEGTAPLTFSIDDDGADYSVDATTGEIAAGDTFDLWVELTVAADGDGPTPFEVPIDVASDGGDRTIVVSGQVEKPGYLIADYADLPLVDHRGVISFTNVGELPIEIIGLDAPGITTALIPDEVAAGATWELEIALCADTTIEPELTWTLTEVGFLYRSWVTVETPTSESTTAVSSFAVGTPLPSCEPVIDPIDVIVLEVALP